MAVVTAFELAVEWRQEVRAQLGLVVERMSGVW